MLNSTRSRQCLLAVMCAMAAFSAIALNDVIVAGKSYTCQNTCVVGVTQGGGWYVYDSEGGWLRENFKSPPKSDPPPA